MRLRFSPLTAEQAHIIAGWRYPPPFDFYNGAGDGADLGELLDRSNPYYAAVDESADLVGFFCFKQTAQVPAGYLAGAYADPDALDLGLAFVEEGLAFAREPFAPGSFRLSVAAFNRRAITVYERAGFRPTTTFVNRSNGGEHEFLVMVRPASPSRFSADAPPSE
jgi:ribosomal protein S18 acetylase RimI-like enzyme